MNPEWRKDKNQICLSDFRTVVARKIKYISYISYKFQVTLKQPIEPKTKQMKTMTCNQLGGACDTKFQAETFEEMAELSKEHGMEMFQKGDEAHLAAMQNMKPLLKSPEAMQAWFSERRREFEALPED